MNSASNCQSDPGTALAKLLDHIRRLDEGRAYGETAVLEKIASLADRFIAAHPELFTFEQFPLPTEPDAVSCAYQLTEEGTRPALIVNAIRGGVNSAVHDHGTWAVIAGAIGEERNRIYECRHTTAAGPDEVGIELKGEVVVRPGRPLTLPEATFHSIHTMEGVAALQLHVYGSEPDENPDRQAFDPTTGRRVYLSPPAQ